MAPQHGDRLTAIDAGFLAQETGSAHMHVGALLIFGGPPPTYEALADHVRTRLHLVPRYRQRLAFPPLESGRPVWVDDEAFSLEFHLRHVALPGTGAEDDLRALVGRIHSQRLDRARPLWEVWLVENLEGGRFALYFKTHHALVDGVGGVDLATVLFDLDPLPRPVPHSDRAWAPRPAPTRVGLVARGLRGLVRAPLALAGRAAAAATHPGDAVDAARTVLEGLGEVAVVALNPAPATPLNVPIGPHRRLALVRCELAELKQVKNAFGGTVNDVVLTVVAGALGRWLRSRGITTDGLQLRALVPVSIRTSAEHGLMGNRIAAMQGLLPIGIEDPVARLRTVRAAMDGLKESKQAIGAEVLAAAQNLAPPTVLAQASRINFSTRLFNLLVTNIPGPQFPLYILGRRLIDTFPVAFLPRRHALAIAAMSYDGGIDFGLLADADALPDVDVLAHDIEAALAELLAAAVAGEREPAPAAQ